MSCSHWSRSCCFLSCSIVLFAGTSQCSTSGQSQRPSAAASGSQPSEEQTRPDVLTSDAFANLPPCGEKSPQSCATPPRLIDAPSPTFTPEPNYKRGVCVLSLIVEPNGKTSNIHVLKPLSVDQDRLATEAVKKWKFKPAMKDGKPVAAKIAVEVRY